MLETRSIVDADPHTVHQDAIDEVPEDVTAKLEALDLPLVVMWPPGAHAVDIFVSGTAAGPTSTQGVARRLAARGIAVVGWNTLRYFWLREVAADLRRTISRGSCGRYRKTPPSSPAGTRSAPRPVPVVVAAATDRRSSASQGSRSSDRAPTPHSRSRRSIGSGRSSKRRGARWGPRSSQPARPVLRGHGRRPGYRMSCGSAPCLHAPAVPGGHHFGADYAGLASRIAAFIDSERHRADARRLTLS